MPFFRQQTGTDAPYFAGPDERVPRDPIGGDMVGIGFLTQPGRAASDVRLFWTRNGRPQTPLQGRPVAQGNDADRWLCELGVLEAGDMVEYWMVATGNQQRAETERYGFGVRRQRRLAGISASAQHAHGWTLATRATMVSGPTLLLALIQDQHTLQITVGSAAAVAQNSPPRDAIITLRDTGATFEVDAASGRCTFQTGTQRVPLALRWLEEADGRLAAVELTGALALGEALVGFGERFDALDQRGRAPDVAVWEQYKIRAIAPTCQCRSSAPARATAAWSKAARTWPTILGARSTTAGAAWRRPTAVARSRSTCSPARRWRSCTISPR